jgi:hypothetical protein
MAKTVQDSKTRSDESRRGERDITSRDRPAGGSDAGVTNAEMAPNDAAPLGAAPLDQREAVADEAPPVPASPFTAEDPSRTLHAAHRPTADAKPSFPGFPKTKYHPVYGGRTIDDPNEEAALVPVHNWFDTAEEADMHRTDREAQLVVHNNRRVKADASVAAFDNDGTHDVPDDVVRGETGIVRNSVAATESLKSGFAEPL